MTTSNQPDLLPLQLWLAKQLPEEIYGYRDERDLTWIHELNEDGLPLLVTPREWDYIVRRVEEKLKDLDWFNYTRELSLLVRRAKQAELQISQYILAPWQSRAIALQRTLEPQKQQ